jgi:PAS domain S-box-containing protein
MKSILIADDKPENLRQLEAKMLELEQRNRELEADIAARQQVEAGLQKSEARFRAYVEQAAEVIVVHDFAGKFLEVNQQACETLGYTREELLRLGVFDIEVDVQIAQAQAAWKQLIPGHHGTARGRHRRKDGSIFPVEMRFGAFDVKGERFYVGMARDITERLQAEAELQRMRFGVDHADDAIFWVSREG